MSFRHAHTVTETSDTTDELNGPAAHVADGAGLVGRGEAGFGPCTLIALSGAFEIVAGQMRLAAGGHSHAIGDIAALQSALDGKAAAAHGHAIADVTNLQSALDGKAEVAHGHAISHVTNLQSALDAKADAVHGHAAADVTDFAAAARAQTEAMVLAGVNFAITYAGTGATRTATLAAVGGPGSYAALTGNRAATAADNGRVVECDGTNRTLTMPAGLGRGFSCVVRRTAAGDATVARGTGVTFAPTDASVSTAALWDEITIECIADTGSAATYLVRLVSA